MSFQSYSQPEEAEDPVDNSLDLLIEGAGEERVGRQRLFPEQVVAQRQVVEILASLRQRQPFDRFAREVQLAACSRRSRSRAATTL